MSLQWDDSLILGLDEIDSQHKTIFEHFEKLSEATQKGTSKEIIEELAVFLFDYAQVHFTTEDKIMTEYKYPEIETQRHEHGEFTRDANEIKKRIERDGATREVAIEVTGKLLRWIINHIKKHDKEMVEYIKECIALRQKYES
jgi:hemerythrin-like metal-binding protein